MVESQVQGYQTDGSSAVRKTICNVEAFQSITQHCYQYMLEHHCEGVETDFFPVDVPCHRRIELIRQ